MTGAPLDAAPSRSVWYRSRWTALLVGEAIALLAIVGIVLGLQYSEEGYLRRNGIQVTATVSNQPSGESSCMRCRLQFRVGQERYFVYETLGARYDSDERPHRYVNGEAVDLYVDPDDMSHTIEVDAVGNNVRLGLVGIAIAVAFAVALPIVVCKATRWPPTTDSPMAAPNLPRTARPQPSMSPTTSARVGRRPRRDVW